MLKKGKKFHWSPECGSAIEKIGLILLSAAALQVPDFQKQFKLFLDAGDVGIGAIRRLFWSVPSSVLLFEEVELPPKELFDQ